MRKPRQATVEAKLSIYIKGVTQKGNMCSGEPPESGVRNDPNSDFLSTYDNIYMHLVELKVKDMFFGWRVNWCKNHETVERFWNGMR